MPQWGMVTLQLFFLTVRILGMCAYIPSVFFKPQEAVV